MPMREEDRGVIPLAREGLQWASQWIDQVEALTDLDEVKFGDAEAEVDKARALLAAINGDDGEGFEVAFDQLEYLLITRMKRLGASWASIAEAVGTTPQGLARRYERGYENMGDRERTLLRNALKPPAEREPLPSPPGPESKRLQGS